MTKPVFLITVAMLGLSLLGTGCHYNTYQQVDSKWGVRSFYPNEACSDLHLIRRSSDEYWALRRFCNKQERRAN
ncbi:MAG: hypothetical protein AAF530_17105 [Pseudomonadota bacterium]